MTKPISSKKIPRHLPLRIGGPGTLLPKLFESFLSWALAISCLGVALWHYQVDKYKTRLFLAYGCPSPSDDQLKKRLLLPLTTHSRREWSTVSDYQGLKNRFQQLIRLIYITIILPAHPTRVPKDEKKVDGEHSLDENQCVIVHGITFQEKENASIADIVTKWLKKGRGTIKCGSGKDDKILCLESREMLVQLIRTDERARRLASLLLGEDPIDGGVEKRTRSSTNSSISGRQISKRETKEQWLDHLSNEEPGAEALLYSLRKIWQQLLELPAAKNYSSNTNENIVISIIVPSFREEGGTLADKLEASLENAAEPHRIEIIVVLVVENDQRQNIEETPDKSSNGSISSFAKALQERFEPLIEDRGDNGATVSGRPELRILEYHGGGGRGPCLNFGAKHARGSILTFLHADTRLATRGWDKAISDALDENKNGRRRTTLCAFSFAIDTSPEALTIRQKNRSDCDKDESKIRRDESNDNQQYYPPGLRAIEVTANLRCKFFALPYGDQCLSIPTNIFRFVGGYPDQCLMEDYELIRLLRMRSAASDGKQEAVKILFDFKAICSPRRWQHYGVLHVTYTNSYCVKLYNSGKLTPDDLFCRYYKTSTPPNRLNGAKSPWEIDL